MKKFILKSISVLLPLILINLVFGVIRNKNGDETIPYRQNWIQQFISHGQIDSHIGFSITNYQMFDMSRETRNYHLVRFKDKWGFQNVTDIKNPDILFIGDSFFDDPYLSYDQGLSQKFSQSMNIASMGCSGFKVFNELKNYGYFTKPPKYIVIEVVERNLILWSDLFKQIENNIMKSIPYNNCGLDLIFGNNLKGVNLDNLTLNKFSIAPKKQGVLRKTDKYRSIWFYKNRITQINSREEKEILKNMKLVTEHFKKINTKVIFLVAPDKESIFPEIFKESNLPNLQNKFDSLKITYIDMHKAIMESSNRKKCYYVGDTHWNQYAYRILSEKIESKFDSLNPNLCN